MKKIMCILVASMIVLLSGCSSYERDSSSGTTDYLTVEQMQEKIEKKDSFIIVFTQTTCAHCIDFKKMLDIYLEDHNVSVYDVVLDEEPKENQEENLKVIRKTFPAMNSTPSLYYVKEGKMDNQLENGDDGLTEQKFDSWVQKYELDDKK